MRSTKFIFFIMCFFIIKSYSITGLQMIDKSKLNITMKNMKKEGNSYWVDKKWLPNFEPYECWFNVSLPRVEHISKIVIDCKEMVISHDETILWPGLKNFVIVYKDPEIDEWITLKKFKENNEPSITIEDELFETKEIRINIGYFYRTDGDSYVGGLRKIQIFKVPAEPAKETDEINLSDLSKKLLQIPAEPVKEPAVEIPSKLAIETTAQIPSDEIPIVKEKSEAEKVVDELKSQDGSSRLETIKKLGDLGDKSAAPALVELLSDESITIRRESAFSLARLGDKSGASILTEALDSKDSALRAKVVDSLGDLRDKSATKTLSKVLLKDKKKNIRAKAAKALGKIGAKSTVEPLSQALNDKSVEVRQEALTSLGKIGGTKAVLALGKGMEDRSPEIRIQTAEILGSSGDQLAIPTLIKALRDRDENVRKKVVESLTELRSKPAAKKPGKKPKPVPGKPEVTKEKKPAKPKLVTETIPAPPVQLLDEKSTTKRKIKLKDVGFLAQRHVNNLDNPDEKVRAKAVTILGKLGEPAVIPALIDLLKDKSPRVRLNTIEALGNLEAKSAVPEIKKCLNDSDENVRKKASQVLKKLK